MQVQKSHADCRLCTALERLAAVAGAGEDAGDQPDSAGQCDAALPGHAAQGPAACARDAALRQQPQVTQLSLQPIEQMPKVSSEVQQCAALGAMSVILFSEWKQRPMRGARLTYDRSYLAQMSSV